MFNQLALVIVSLALMLFLQGIGVPWAIYVVSLAGGYAIGAYDDGALRSQSRDRSTARTQVP